MIELLTGRTHQIRAQLSAAGCPLLGDPLYAPLASPELRQVSARVQHMQPWMPLLQPRAADFSPSFPCPPSALQRLFAGDPCEDLRGGRERLLEEPAGGIGLQACRLLVADACMGGSDDAPAAFEAPPPWWRA